METRSCARLTVPYEANSQAKQVLGAGHRPRLCVRGRAGNRACGPWSRKPGRRSSRVSERVSERANPRLREQQRVPSTGRLRTVNSSIQSANGPRSRPCVSFMVDWSSFLAETAFVYRATSVDPSASRFAQTGRLFSWGVRVQVGTVGTRDLEARLPSFCSIIYYIIYIRCFSSCRARRFEAAPGGWGAVWRERRRRRRGAAGP